MAVVEANDKLLENPAGMLFLVGDWIMPQSVSEQVTSSCYLHHNAQELGGGEDLITRNDSACELRSRTWRTQTDECNAKSIRHL